MSRAAVARCNMENFMLKAFEQLFAMEEYGGKYCSITPGHPNEVSVEEYQVGGDTVGRANRVGGGLVGGRQRILT
jgi:hypothetical protein